MSQDLIHFKVTGTVQGVNFRSYTQKEAKKLGLKGWVTNKPDSSVEGMAVGTAEKIQEFRKYLQRGPSSAEVENVELLKHEQGASEKTISKLVGSLPGFEVR